MQRRSVMAFRVALRLCGHHHVAQDIAQEALIAAWLHLAQFRPARRFHLAVPDPHRRTLNKIIRGRAAVSPDLLAEVADPGAEPADQAERNLAVDAVTDALAALPFPQQAMIVLHHLEGLSYAEVAVVTRSTGLQAVTVNGTIDDVLADDADSR